jgi:hypothetical protein
MTDTRTSSESGGVGFFGLLTLLFIGLKLTGYIKWSWSWVLSPLWISMALGVVIVAIALIVVWVKS